MYYNYLLKSNNKNWYYVGFTENLDKRLKQHNEGYVSSTKAYKPFEIKFVQVSTTKVLARDLEKYLKIRWNKESLIKLIN